MTTIRRPTECNSGHFWKAEQGGNFGRAISPLLSKPGLAKTGLKGANIWSKKKKFEYKDQLHVMFNQKKKFTESPCYCAKS